MEPLDHVKTLIDQRQITEAQWNLFFLATSYLDGFEEGSGSLSMRFRDLQVSAARVAFDVDLPGVLVIQGPQGRKSYWAWAELFAVILPD